MANYHVDVTEDAKTDLTYYNASDRKTIVSEIKAQLVHQPVVATRNRKPLRENPLAAWELRVGKFRIFYSVDETAGTVTIVAVGHKEHDQLLIRGKRVPL